MPKPYYSVGPYIGEVVQQAIGETSTGKPQDILRVKILGTPEADGSYTPVQQYERTIYMVLTEATMKFQVENLRIIGFTGNRITDFAPESDNFQDVTGNQVPLWCGEKAHYKTGEPQEDWSISKGASKIEVKPLDAKGKRSLDSLFAKALKDTPAPVSRKPEDEDQTRPDTSNYTDQGITNDDIPF